MVLVFNGWAAGPETWELCKFQHDYVFNYLEEMAGLPAKIIAEQERVVLVGFSMGGTMALREYLRAPNKVAGMVLISATPKMMEEKSEGWLGMSLHRRAALKLGTATVFKHDPSPLYAEANLDKGLDFLQATDLRAELKALANSELPVEIIQSERDGIVRPNNAEFLKSVFPSATVTMVPGNEHVLPITVPQLVDDAVNRVLKKVGTR